jgi:hypothetical protein
MKETTGREMKEVEFIPLGRVVWERCERYSCRKTMVEGPKKGKYVGWSDQERVSHFSLERAFHSFIV